MSLNPEDILLWPDGDWCFSCDVVGMQHKSDDYERITYDSKQWHELTLDAKELP